MNDYPKKYKQAKIAKRIARKALRRLPTAFIPHLTVDNTGCLWGGSEATTTTTNDSNNFYIIDWETGKCRRG